SMPGLHHSHHHHHPYQHSTASTYMSNLFQPCVPSSFSVSVSSSPTTTITSSSTSVAATSTCLSWTSPASSMSPSLATFSLVRGLTAAHSTPSSSMAPISGGTSSVGATNPSGISSHLGTMYATKRRRRNSKK